MTVIWIFVAGGLGSDRVAGSVAAGASATVIARRDAPVCPVPYTPPGAMPRGQESGSGRSGSRAAPPQRR